MHTAAGVAERFLVDVKSELAKLLLDPTKPVDGKVNENCSQNQHNCITKYIHFCIQMAIYGLAQSQADRTLVGDFTRSYIDSMYYTPNPKE